MKDDVSFLRKLLLHSYHLHVYDFKRQGKVLKIYTDQGNFALKETPRNIGLEFTKWPRELYFLGYPKVVPIIQTADGRSGIFDSDHFYYLMPWISRNRRYKQEEIELKLFRELARIHSLTSKEFPVTEEELKGYYEGIKNTWEEELSFLEKIIETFESRLYMSPFELLYCTIFNDLYKGTIYALHSLENWYNAVKDNKKVRTVFIHGKVRPEHFLLDERGHGYFINFEKSRVHSPIFDLIPYIKRGLKTYPLETVPFEWYQQYIKYFRLRDEEIDLLKSRLAFPKSIIKTVHHYVGNKKICNERMITGKLQSQYWCFKNIEKFVMRVQEWNKQNNEEDISSGEV